MIRAIKIIGLVLVLCLGASCSYFQGSDGSKSTTSKPAASTEVQPDTTYTIPDFPYLPIPRELEYDPHESLVFETLNFKTGILILSGNAEATSLIEFFINNLTAQGWMKKGSIKTKKSIVFFEKPNKSCTIQIDDQTLSTDVQIVIIEIKDSHQQSRPVEEDIVIDEREL